MKSKTRNLLVLGGLFAAAALLFVAVLVPRMQGNEPSALAGIQTVNGHIYYYNEEGFVEHGWQTIDGKLYYFDPETGRAIVGWFTDEEGNVYYFGPDGNALIGSVTLDGKEYVFGADGRLQMGGDASNSPYIWRTQDGNVYCMGPDGKAITGLAEIEGAVYYFDPDGVRQTGWHTIGNKLYYFSPIHGRAPRGWHVIDGKSYYFTPQGYVLTGEQTIEGKTYRFDDKGVLLPEPAPRPQRPGTSGSASSGPQPQGEPQPDPVVAGGDYSFREVDGKTYYMDSKGNYYVGAHKIDGSIYVFDSAGAMLKGWHTVGDKTYNLDEKTGRAILGMAEHPEKAGEFYYMGADGYALSGLQDIADGTVTGKFLFSAAGVRQYGMQLVEGKIYCFEGDQDAALYGWQTPKTTLPAIKKSASMEPGDRRYYFDETDAAALIGVHKLDDGKYYAFSDQGIQLWGWQTIGGFRYRFAGENGSALHGWSLDDEGQPGGQSRGHVWFDEQGRAAIGLTEVGTETYYFSSEGLRQSGWITVGNVRYCFSGTDDAAIKSTWKTDEQGLLCYLGPKGATLSGLWELDGKWYCFNSDGAICTGLLKTEGAWYLFDETTGEALTGWRTLNEKHYYFGSDGKAATGLATIGTARYYFNSEGVRQGGRIKVTGKWYLFDGVDQAAVTGEVQDGSNYYYYGADGAALVGVHQIVESGPYFYFDTDGVRQQGWQTHDGKKYYFNAGTFEAQIGWFPDFGSGHVYYFGPDAAAYVGTTATIDNVQYTFDAQGHVVPPAGSESPSWVVKDGKHYCVGTDGKYLTGLQVVSNYLYYFDESGVRQSGEFKLGSYLYRFSEEDGKAVIGWYTDKTDPDNHKTYYYDPATGRAVSNLQHIGTSLYYFDANCLLKTGAQTLGGKRYYFDPAKGGAAHQGWYPSANAAGASYYGAAGYALTGLQTTAIEDGIYYFDATGKRLSGLQEIGGKWYAFSGTNDKAVVGEYSLTSGEGIRNYLFGADGAAVTGMYVTDAGRYYYGTDGVRHSGWYTDTLGRRYFFGTDGKAVVGHFTDAAGDKASYYFTSDGYALTNGILEQNGTTYEYDKDGKLVRKYATRPHEWVEKDGHWYYIDSEGNFYEGLQTIDDGFYYLEPGTGRRLVGWQSPDEETLYYFDPATGRALKGWFTDSNGSYYLDPVDYHAYTGGPYNINGIDYLFDEVNGRLLNGDVPEVNSWIEVDGAHYYIDSTGNPAVGLHQIEDEWHYFDASGIRQKGRLELPQGIYFFIGAKDAALRGWHEVEGKWYCFDDKTAAQQTGWQLRLDEKTNEYLQYYYNEDGSTLSGWLTMSGYRRYFFPDGRMAAGWETIEEDVYYFYSTGQVATGVVVLEGVQYSFDADGKLATGWNTDEEGNRYYFGPGGLAKGWEQINGVWYLFDDETGVQLLGWRDRSDDEDKAYKHYFYTAGDEKGQSPLDWVDINGVQRYFFPDGSMAIGWNTVPIEGADAVCYFYTSGEVASGETLLEGVIYPFAGNGSLPQGSYTAPNGNKYFFTPVGAALGWAQLDDQWYYFDEVSGILQHGWQTRTKGETQYRYYFFEDYTTPDDWEDIGGKRYYFEGDGYCAVGWRELPYEEGTASYYFEADGHMATGVVTIEGAVYSFGPDGRLIVGWNTDEQGNRYYFDEDSGLATGWTKIESRWYCFHEETGVQQLGWQYRETDDGATLAYYYFPNGSLPKEGWNDITEPFWSGDTSPYAGTPTYVLADGQCAQGWLEVEGEGRYLFSRHGRAERGWQVANNVWYLLDEETGVQQLGWQHRPTELPVPREALHYFYEDGSAPAQGWVENIEGGRRYALLGGEIATGWQTIGAYRYYFNSQGIPLTGTHDVNGESCSFDAEGRFVEPPYIASVTFNKDWNTQRTVTVEAISSPLLGSTALEYSFDAGNTWQSTNQKTFPDGTVLAAGSIRVRDSAGNVVQHDADITLKSSTNRSQGIDVSAWQGAINWQQVAASGQVDYAIIRSLHWDSAGNRYAIDPYFEYNVRNAKAYGIKVGTYLFSYAFNEAEMEQEVQFFMNSPELRRLMAEGIRFDMPVFIDYEADWIVQNTPYLSMDDRSLIVEYGMARIDNLSKYLYGHTFATGVYTYYNYALTALNVTRLQEKGYDLWLARYNSSGHGWSPHPEVWQYSSTGSIPGINGNVDMNYCYKDYSYIDGGKTPTPVQSHSLTVTDQYGQKITAPASTVLAQMVMAEVGGFNNAEVFKAQAVAAQAWIFYNQANGTPAPRVALKTPTADVQNAVNEVVHYNLMYNGAQAFTPYYAYSNGTTNNGGYWGNNFAYLASVSSSWDSVKGTSTGQISRGDLRARINAVYGDGYADRFPESQWIQVIATNAAGYVTQVKVCDRYPTVDFFYQTLIRYADGSGRTVYPLGSPSFTVNFNGSNLWSFTYRGYGHGVGMSQFGASRMAAEGYTWQQILAHYYPGTTLVKI